MTIPVRPLSERAAYNAARSMNNSRRQRMRVSPTTSAPVDDHGERSIISGRFPCVIAYPKHDERSTHQMWRYVRRFGLSVKVIDEAGGTTLAVEVSATDAPTLLAFCGESFIHRWELKTTARPPMSSQGSASEETLSRRQKREVVRPSMGLRRYDLQPEHNRNELRRTLTAEVAVVLMGAVESGKMTGQMARDLVDCLEGGELTGADIVAYVKTL